jgi:hypothetical protein
LPIQMITAAASRTNTIVMMVIPLKMLHCKKTQEYCRVDGDHHHRAVIHIHIPRVPYHAMWQESKLVTAA